MRVIMLFMATHTHLAEKCISNNPDLVKKFRAVLSEEEAEKQGCDLLGVYVAPTEHIAYILLRAEEHDSLLNFLRPLVKLGETRIRPVTEWKDLSKRL